MGLLKHFRSRSKIKDDARTAAARRSNEDNDGYPRPAYLIPPPFDCIQALSEHPNILQRVFSYVCPHSEDVSFASLETIRGAIKECPLCGIKDLAACARVRQGWNQLATQQL